MQRVYLRSLISRCSLPFLVPCRFITGEDFHQVDWNTGALKYLRYVGVDIPNMIRLYKRFGNTKHFSRDNVANLVEFFDQIGVRGNSIKNSIICAPDLLRVSTETLEARGCWYRHIFGLSHQEFRDVVELYPNILEDKGTKRFEEAYDYFMDLGLTKSQFRDMILKCPSFLHLSIEDSISKTLGFFLERDVPKSEVLNAVREFPELLQYSLIGHILPKAHYFETELEISEKVFAQVFVKHAWVLGLNLEGDIRHTVQWLLDFGASKAILGKVILKFPAVLGYSVENNFKPKLDYFVHYLGMPFGDVAHIIETYPGFAASSLKENIRPFVWCLEHELSMSFTDIQSVFTGAPLIFGLSFAQTIKPTINYFTEELGCRKDQFAQMLTRFPQVLCYSLEDNIKPRVQWLRETVDIPEDKIKTAVLHRIYEHKILNLNNKLSFLRSQLDVGHGEICSMIAEDTSILHKTLSNLAKKLAFLEEVLKKPRSELTTMPQYLGFSLETRLKPRAEFLQSIRKDPAAFSLQEMFSTSDKEFSTTLGNKTYLQFKEQRLYELASNQEDEDDKAEEQMLEETFLQEQDLVPVEEIREAERRFALNFKYQTILE